MQEIDDSTLRRFLRARDLNTEKACGMVVKYLKWRRTKGCISPEQVPNEISQKKLFLQGSDKLGRPVLLLLGSRHFQNTIGGVEEFKRKLLNCSFLIFRRSDVVNIQIVTRNFVPQILFSSLILPLTLL